MMIRFAKMCLLLDLMKSCQSSLSRWTLAKVCVHASDESRKFIGLGPRPYFDQGSQRQEAPDSQKFFNLDPGLKFPHF